jgi:hypothetical protein
LVSSVTVGQEGVRRDWGKSRCDPAHLPQTKRRGGTAVVLEFQVETTG